MAKKLESTPLRENRRRYEERNREKRLATSKSFQAMLPMADYTEITSFVESHNMTKVQFMKEAFELMKVKYQN